MLLVRRKRAVEVAERMFQIGVFIGYALGAATVTLLFVFLSRGDKKND